MQALDPALAAAHRQLAVENEALKIRLCEMEETVQAIYGGEVDALVVNNDIFLLESAGIASNRLRQDVLGQMHDAVFAFDSEDNLIFLNAAAEFQYALNASDALGRPKTALFDESPEEDADEGTDPAPTDVDDRKRPHAAAVHRLRNGRSIHVEISVSTLVDAKGQVFGSLAVVRDVSQRRRATARRNALARFSESLRDVGSCAEVVAAAAAIQEETLKAGRAEVDGAASKPWAEDDLQFIEELAERTRAATEQIRTSIALRDSEARLREVNESLEAKVIQRSHELLTAQEALRQAQKMESVGQLTGGIAHDFNNMLAGMSASLQVLQARMQQGRMEGAERYITMSQEAVKRAAALTQRLLAFARRQTLDPKPTDINRLIAGLEELIRRSVGPTVVVEVVGAGGLWATKVDPSQLENSLLNLCINARDAMAPDGGRLTIETANKWLDERTAGERDLTPGQYVSLCVTDTGSGMDAEVIGRIFDPFFTTKPMGQGTGLGLSMVYGFVRQSGGQVRVYSELGRGTTMCLYLPRHLGPAEADQSSAQATEIENGTGERVLVIEDEETIRTLMAEVLQEAGYDVVTAHDGASGLQILQAPGRIDLLITDVGLPGGLNGRQVADAARVHRKTLKVLFITGYAENAVVGNGLLEPGMQVLTKPFDIFTLAKKVREMSESSPR